MSHHGSDEAAPGANARAAVVNALSCIACFSSARHMSASAELWPTALDPAIYSWPYGKNPKGSCALGCAGGHRRNRDGGCLKWTPPPRWPGLPRLDLWLLVCSFSRWLWAGIEYCLPYAGPGRALFTRLEPVMHFREFCLSSAAKAYPAAGSPPAHRKVTARGDD